MGLHLDSAGDGTVAEHFHQGLLRDETGVAEILDSDPGQTSSGCERLESVEIDCLVFNAVDVVETELRHTALERHLTSLEAHFVLVART